MGNVKRRKFWIQTLYKCTVENEVINGMAIIGFQHPFFKKKKNIGKIT